MATKEISIQPEARTYGTTAWQRFSAKATPYLFISPFYVVFLVFQLFPILFSVVLSFSDWNGSTAIKFTGLENFTTMFADAKFWNSLRVSFTITVVCTVVGTAGSTLLAVLLEKVEDALAGVLRVIFFLPSVTSVVVIAYIWRQLYSGDYGFFNVLLSKVGIPAQDWLQDPQLAMPALLVMLIWAGLGWDALIITSGLRAISDELYDAGKVDGTNDWTEFRYLTLPLLRPTLLFVLVTSVIYLWGLFAQAQLLTAGGPLRATQPIALYLYSQGFQYKKFGYASAIAIVLSLIMFVSSYLNFRFIKYDSE